VGLVDTWPIIDARVDSQHVSTTLRALAKLKFYDKSIYQAIAMRLTRDEAHQCQSQHLSRSVWALAKAEVTVDEMGMFDTTLGLQKPALSQKEPVAMCFALTAEELIRRPHHFNAQGIKDVLWSFSTAGIRHPILFRSVAEHIVGPAVGCKAHGLDEFSPQGLVNVAWAFAKQAQLAESSSKRLNLRCVGRRQTICLDIGEALLQRLFVAMAETSLRMDDELQKASPRHISNLAWAFANLGLKETRFFEATKVALVERVERYVLGETNLMTSFNGQHLGNLLWALATLNVLEGNTLAALKPYIRKVCEDSEGKVTAMSISQHFDRQALASMAWACAVCGDYPDELMDLLYTGLVGPQVDVHDPVYMRSVHKDSGLQMQAINTLIYVQAEKDLRGCAPDLALPINFPDGWMQSETDRTFPDEHWTDDAMELSLSTSKIQHAVSEALARIGFDHVEEHSVTMAELSSRHGVRVPSRQIDTLSMDIANIKERIAIEVDGPSHYSTCIDGVRGCDESKVSTKMMNGKLDYRFGWTGECQEIDGATALKTRVLQSLGWKVIRVPFWEWNALGGDTAAKEKYCSELLTLNH
jgi:very-short-patch-repair endonuclease